jgi:hypothetical protein
MFLSFACCPISAMFTPSNVTSLIKSQNTTLSRASKNVNALKAQTRVSLNLHCVWRRIRAPFHVICCSSHDWEIYGIQSAGCLKCGTEHACAKDLCESQCPLVETDEGGVCCTITGYCLPTLRLSNHEYVDSVYFTAPNKGNTAAPISMDEIESVVQWFIMGKQSLKSKREDSLKTLNRYQNELIKNFKLQKMERHRANTSTRPCVVSIIAQTMQQVKPKYILKGTPELCRQCSQYIMKCLKNLNLINIQNKKINIIVGMLFLMKQGLVIQNIQWLPRITPLQHCLPHETSLEKSFKLCMKLVCETENEIKLALRQRICLT